MKLFSSQNKPEHIYVDIYFYIYHEFVYLFEHIYIFEYILKDISRDNLIVSMVLNLRSLGGVFLP